MQDQYGREIDYFRISITDKCNLRCKYCMPEAIPSVPMSEILSFEEIEEIVTQAASCGIHRIKITGGEPLIRQDCIHLIRRLKKVPGIRQVTLTTNGVLLEKYLGELCDAGINAVNISMDTTDPKRYCLITGDDKLSQVLRGLHLAVNAGLKVKINAVSVDWNRYSGIEQKDRSREPFRDAFDLIALAKDEAVDVRFIEMMPIGFGKGFASLSHGELIPAVRGRYRDMVLDEAPHGNGPAVYYKIPGFRGSIGFISSIHGSFCQSCNRIRLTTQGYLKSCLCYGNGVDLKPVIRGELFGKEKEEALRAGIERAILCKPESHCFGEEGKISEKHGMSEIGG